MNSHLLNVLKEIVEKNGESLLSEPRRIAAFFADLAREVLPCNTALLYINVREIQSDFPKVITVSEKIDGLRPYVEALQ